MTATLADDGVLVSHFQAAAEQVADPIRPKGGGDIGDRMILAPQEINPDITIDEIKALVADKAKTINVAVIVPSKKRAEFWSDIASQTLTAENIEDGTDKLRKGHVGLTVFVGKYDGVDLPAKACEGRGPDNLWALGALQYLVIECKSGAVKASSINKHDCNQLNGSMNWFADKYDKSCSALRSWCIQRSRLSTPRPCMPTRGSSQRNAWRV
ncbi:hypothetical protein HU675_0020150 [Bradyrhizobium septentrionale]|uniref:hypothetical protein n=1 Tax=Bradyrhizobium septentrionale TaxID=1404411 RepID=UPI001CD7A086|nr:hypothetical protein [Bradyrhizobium septentrionale]UGY28893.1 hypothetical protein HU675_0020150 [Bradyrhizobium septentrionale]